MRRLRGPPTFIATCSTYLPCGPCPFTPAPPRLVCVRGAAAVAGGQIYTTSSAFTHDLDRVDGSPLASADGCPSLSDDGSRPPVGSCPIVGCSPQRAPAPSEPPPWRRPAGLPQAAHHHPPPTAGLSVCVPCRLIAALPSPCLRFAAAVATLRHPGPLPPYPSLTLPPSAPPCRRVSAPPLAAVSPPLP